MKPTIGSIWWGGGSKKFRVTKIFEDNGMTWVEYEEEAFVKQQYSCYVEAFLARFSELPK